MTATRKQRVLLCCVANLISCFAHACKFIRRILGLIICKGTHGDEVGSGTALEVGKVAGSIPGNGVTGMFH